LIFPFHVGANEKFPMHSKSFVAKPKLSNRPKTDYSPEFQIRPKPRGFKRTYTCPAFWVVRSRNPAHRANVTVLKHNSYNNHRFCSGGSSKNPEV